MARYTKFKSNYIRRTKHQNLKGGDSIFERDWVTLGSQLRFGENKIPYYNNGNFVFTRTNIPNFQKKHKLGEEVGKWTYDDVVGEKDIEYGYYINNSDDIRHYAYYGSSLELVRVSLENIIRHFPCNFKTGNEVIARSKVGDKILNFYEVINPFKICFERQYNPKTDDEILRYMKDSHYKYEFNGETIDGYDVICRKFYGKLDGNGNVVSYDYLSKPQDGWIEIDCEPETWSPKDGHSLYTAYIKHGKKNLMLIDAYRNEGEIIHLSINKNCEVKPQENIIDSYFKGLEGFERKLLNRKSKPLYSNTFITPIEGNLRYYYYKRTYTWPCDGYCIDIESPVYVDFVKRLTDMASVMDEIWTNNIYNRMTHESIKNYDWTYTRSYNEGDEEENIRGGERMQKTLYVIGRVFDNIKEKIDSIKYYNTVTYDGINNCPKDKIKQELELRGWDLYSVTPIFENIDYSSYKIGNGLPFNEGGTDLRWFNNINMSNLTVFDIEQQFMRNFFLSSRDILLSKGTIQGIDMLMALFGYGGNDYSLTEEYLITKPVAFDTIPEGWDESFGERILRINKEKDEVAASYENLSGIPVGFFNMSSIDGDKIKQETYMIPFYDNKVDYDGNLYFQCKGGWGYDIDRQNGDEINAYGFRETLSYLHVMPKIDDLLKINPNSVREGDIFYVFDLSDYTEYSENPDTELASHFFVLEDDFNVELFSSWRNINLDDNEDRYSLKANYLNNIFSTNAGNNPHVGYGNYDNGNCFFEYMKQPFKNAIDKSLLSIETEEDAKAVNFEISEPIKTENVINSENVGPLEDKVKIFNDRSRARRLLKYRTPDGKSIYHKNNRGNDVFVRHYDKNLTNKIKREKYYLNNKVLVFENKIDNQFYITYFRNVILKYLMQIIPSTTILILKNF